MRALSDCKLYGILDLGYVPDANLESMTESLIAGGVDILQIRAKKRTASEVESIARRIHPITRSGGIPLVINDFPEVAAAVGTEGIHVGQDDQGIAATRSIVGPDCFVGKSTHSLAQAAAAMEEGADYIGFGPLFPTGTKPDYTAIGLSDIRRVHEFATRPVFCIGGVNETTLPSVLAAGARRVVVVSAFLLAPGVEAYVRKVKSALP